MNAPTSFTKKQQILELYFCSSERNLRIIAEIVSVSPKTVSDTIQDFFESKIHFERGQFKIYHSEINYTKQP